MYRNDELQHRGVKGMKWGVRKKRTITPSDDSVEYKRIKKKKVSEMTNAELKKHNDRANLERNYKQLNQSVISRGIAVIGAATALTGTACTLYGNSNKLVRMGKAVAGKLFKGGGS